VNAQFQQMTMFESDPTGMLNSPLWMPNQGFSSIWMALSNQPKWKQFMTALYTIVNMGLGQASRDSFVFKNMQSNYFSSAADIGNNLFSGTTVPPQAVLDVMFSDPWYGLQNPNNYFRWNQLRPIGNTNITEYNMKTAWQ